MSYPLCERCGTRHKQCKPDDAEREGLTYEIPPDRVQEFVIPGQLEGMNEIIGKARTGWKASDRQKNKQQKLVMDEIFVNKIQPIPGEFRMELVWVEKDAKREPDNITAAKKFILDALQAMDVIQNNSMDFVKGWTESWQIEAADKPAGIYVKLIEE